MDGKDFFSGFRKGQAGIVKLASVQFLVVGAYYSFNVKYADEPVKLSVEMADFLHGGEAVNRPNNALPDLP